MELAQGSTMRMDVRMLRCCSGCEHACISNIWSRPSWVILTLLKIAWASQGNTGLCTLMDPEYLVIYLRAHWWSLNIHLTYILERTCLYTIQVYLNNPEYLLYLCTLPIYLRGPEYIIPYKCTWIFTLCTLLTYLRTLKYIIWHYYLALSLENRSVQKFGIYFLKIHELYLSKIFSRAFQAQNGYSFFLP